MQMAVRVAVAGATGYAGGELLRLLLAHSGVAIGALTASASAGTLLGQHHPQLIPLLDRVVEETSRDTLADHDVVFLALPHGASGEVAAQLHPETVVIDCGADFDWSRRRPGSGSTNHLTPALGRTDCPSFRASGTSWPAREPSPCQVAIRQPPPWPCYRPLRTVCGGRDVVIVAASGPPVPGARSSRICWARAHGVRGCLRRRRRPPAHPGAPAEPSRRAGADHEVSFTPVLVPMSRGILATCTAPLARPGISAA